MTEYKVPEVLETWLPKTTVLCRKMMHSSNALRNYKQEEQETNPAWLCDFLRYKIEKGLRAVCFTVERSLLFTHSVTFPAQQLVTSRFTTRYIQEKCLLIAGNATVPALQLATSRDTC